MQHFFRLLAKTATAGILFSGIFLSSAAGSQEAVITHIDRDQVMLNTGQTVKLAGIDMTNLSSKKRPALMFTNEVTGYLKKFIGRTVEIEYESSGNPVTVYLYYYEDTDSLQMKTTRGVQQVLMVKEVKAVNNSLKARLNPELRFMLNLELLRKGYARVETSREFRHKRDFLLIEREAQLDQAGIWE